MGSEKGLPGFQETPGWPLWLFEPGLCLQPHGLGFPRQEYWSGLPFPPPRYFPHPGIKPMSNPNLLLRSLALQTDSLPAE